MFAASRTMRAVDLTLAIYWPEGGNGGNDDMLAVDGSQKREMASETDATCRKRRTATQSSPSHVRRRSRCDINSDVDLLPIRGGSASHAGPHTPPPRRPRNQVHGCTQTSCLAACVRVSLIDLDRPHIPYRHQRPLASCIVSSRPTHSFNHATIYHPPPLHPLIRHQGQLARHPAAYGSRPLHHPRRR